MPSRIMLNEVRIGIPGDLSSPWRTSLRITWVTTCLHIHQLRHPLQAVDENAVGFCSFHCLHFLALDLIIMLFSSGLVPLSLAIFTAAANAEQLPLQEAISSVPPSPPPVTYIPPIGLGLWQSKGKDATVAIGHAFDAGYRHLDGAAAYGNEDYVGHALNNSLLPRSSYWLTSKLWSK